MTQILQTAQMIFAHLFIFAYCFAICYYDPFTSPQTESQNSEPQQISYGDYSLLSSLSRQGEMQWKLEK